MNHSEIELGEVCPACNKTIYCGAINPTGPDYYEELTESEKLSHPEWARSGGDCSDPT